MKKTISLSLNTNQISGSQPGISNLGGKLSDISSRLHSGTHSVKNSIPVLQSSTTRNSQVTR